MKKFYTLLLLVVAITATAQVSNQQEPPSWGLLLKSQPAPQIMPEFDLQDMIAQDQLQEQQDLKKPYRFGKKFQVAMDLFNSGQWTQLDNGDRIWRLNVVSVGARTMNFVLDQYSLPPGAQMYIYNNDHSDKIGPYTANENQEDGILGTWIVYGDNVWIEYYEPAAVTGLGRVSINEVVHGYRGFGTPEEQFLKLNESGACNVDVMCNPNQGASNGQDWTTIRDDYRHSVARIIINGSGLCTGTLVNNVREDGAPYFLTANHCLGSGVADGAGSSYNASGWSFGFDWFTNTPSCASFTNTAGPLNPSRVMSGATLRANRGATDVALFELNSTPPAAWNLYYAGWSRSSTPATSQLGMHHPSGDIMKLARNDQSVSPITVSGIACWNVADWDYGVTEGGSSGSCLINQNGHIVGQLLGGGAACSGTNDNGQPDFYGRLDLSWTGAGTTPTRLSSWLDPDNTGAITYDGDYFNTLGVSSVDGFTYSVYPNPSSDVFYFDIDQDATYQVFNLSGQLIKSGALIAQDARINMSTSADGVYFVQLTTAANQTTIKLIKE